MTEETAQPFSPDPPESPDRDNPAFDFDTLKWQEAPPISEDGGEDSTSLPNPRQQFMTNYRLLATPTEWNRYIHLGLFAYEDGQTFTTTWNNDKTTWLFRHKIIWYNYKYHLDHSMDTSVLLHNWATKLSQPYLLHHQEEFLALDTRNMSWRTMQQSKIYGGPDGWETVGQKKKSSLKKHVTYSDTSTVSDGTKRISPVQSGASKVGEQQNAGTGLTILSPLRNTGVLYPPPRTNPGKNTILLKSTMGILHKNADTKLNSMARKSAEAIRAAWNRKHPPPNDLEPVIGITTSTTEVSDTVTETAALLDTTMHDATATSNKPARPNTNADEQSAMTEDSDGKQSAFRPRLNVDTNDGTMRITIRWKPTDTTLSHTRNLTQWTEAALTMMQELFPDEQGSAYRWESQDLTTWKNMSSMQPTELRDFISPSVTYLSSTGTFIFGFRFGFTTSNPGSWKSHTSTKEVMRNHQVWTTESNSSCTSGKLVNAGYILMKAPNTTHTIRYLQSLRNRLPDNTPFFDVALKKKSPLEQPIHHLVVQCGENHVAPLTKAISALLTGTGGAIFLPRLVLGNLTKDQISKYFTAHGNYVKSLRPISLAPRITNLDTIRDEYWDNGEVLQRSTREWATSLILCNGSSARCDIVNGGKDQVATLLVPSHHFSEVAELYEKYKMRLNPLERREARFRDAFPGLPAVIQIDTSVQASLECLELFSSEEIWKRAPGAVKTTTSHRPSTKLKNSAKERTFQGMAGASSSAPAAASRPILADDTSTAGSDSDDSRNPQSGSKSSKRRRRGKNKPTSAAKQPDQTVTVTSTLTNSQEYQEMSNKIQQQQSQLDDGLAASSDRLGVMEEQLKELKRLDLMEQNIATSMAYHVATNTTLQSLQKQQNQILHLISALTVDAKKQKLNQNKLSIDQEMEELTTPSQLTAVYFPTATSSVEASTPGVTSSLSLASRVRNIPVPSDHRPLSKKQKPDHSNMSNTTSTANSGNPSSATTNVHSATSPEIIPVTPNIQQANPMDEPMEFASDDEVSSMNSATDLDDQYNYQTDPDGGDTG